MIRDVLLSGLLLLSGLTLIFGEENPHGNARVTTSFQNGVNGYSGTIDSEIWALAPTTILDGNGNASTDADNDGGESQVPPAGNRCLQIVDVTRRSASVNRDERQSRKRSSGVVPK